MDEVKVEVEDALFSSSSNSIRTDGVKSSSNWPLFTLHKKAVRKPPATRMLIPINTNSALKRIWFNVIYKSIGTTYFWR